MRCVYETQQISLYGNIIKEKETHQREIQTLRGPSTWYCHVGDVLWWEKRYWISEWIRHEFIETNLRNSLLPMSFLSCSSHIYPRLGGNAGPQRWGSTSFLFTVLPPVGLTVRPDTLWRTATAAWSTCQVSALCREYWGPLYISYPKGKVFPSA